MDFGFAESRRLIQDNGDAAEHEDLIVSLHAKRLFVERRVNRAARLAASPLQFSDDLRMLPDDKDRLALGRAEQPGVDAEVAVREPTLTRLGFGQDAIHQAALVGVAV